MPREPNGHRIPSIFLEEVLAHPGFEKKKQSEELVIFHSISAWKGSYQWKDSALWQRTGSAEAGGMVVARICSVYLKGRLRVG